jgi:hypothetical protein
VLTVMVASLLLQVVQSYATQTAARGSAILTVDALNMLLVAALVFLILRQVMPIAAALAGGSPLSSLGLVSRAIGAAARTSRTAAQLPLPAVRYIASYVAKSVAQSPKFAPEGAADAARAAGRANARRDAAVAALTRHWRQP